MNKSVLTEAAVEQFAINGLLSNGFSVGKASEVAADRSQQRYFTPIIERRLQSAIERLNQEMHGAIVTDTIRSVLLLLFATLIEKNRHFHGLLTDGVPVEYKDAKTGETRGGRARVIDFDTCANNDFLIVRQLAVQGAERKDDSAGSDSVRQRAAAGGDRT